MTQSQGGQVLIGGPFDYRLNMIAEQEKRTKSFWVNPRHKIVIKYGGYRKVEISEEQSMGLGEVSFELSEGTIPTTFLLVPAKLNHAAEHQWMWGHGPVMQMAGLPPLDYQIPVECFRKEIKTVVIKCYEGVTPQKVVSWPINGQECTAACYIVLNLT